MRKLTLLLLLIACLALNAQAAAEKQGGRKFEEQQFTTSDGLTLSAWFASPESDKKAPLVLLLHMLSKTHDSYAPFLDALHKYIQADSTNKNKTLPYILNFDLRGHGKSTTIGDSTFHYRDMSKADFKKIPNDVSRMVLHILADSSLNVDSDNIMIIGASIGANSAVMLTELLPGVSKVIMLSPGENYRGLKPSSAVKSFKGIMLIYTGTEDEYSAISSQKLVDLNKKNCTLRTFKGKDHGTHIINNDPKAMQQLLEWLLP